MKPTEYLAHWLEQKAGPWQIGEVLITPGYHLRHCADESLPAESLSLLPDYAAIREWIKLDADGNFRPVRGARGLRRGWRSGPWSVSELSLILQWIYPIAVAAWSQREQGRLVATTFAETAARQTGMYRITQIIKPEQLSETTARTCEKLCLRQRLWEKPDLVVAAAPNEIPLLCPEVCNFYVGQARATIKGEA